MTTATRDRWPLALQCAAAAALAFTLLALVCDAIWAPPEAHAPVRSADTGAMELLAPLVWALQLFGLVLAALPAALTGAALGHFARAGLSTPVLALLSVIGGLLAAALYTRVAGAGTALELEHPAAALLCGLGAAGAAFVVIRRHPSPTRLTQ